MKATATVLCNNILQRAKIEHIAITPMKLQKLLYYVCVKYVQTTGISPISEAFEVWKYGPVVPSVYSEFRPFGASAILGYAKNAKGEAMVVKESYNPILKGCIEYVWEKFKYVSAIELSKRTHKQGSGWYSAYQRYDENISIEDMKNDCTI